MMRIVVVVFAALLTLGLAAFGVVAAQRANAPAASTAMAAQVAPNARPTPVRAPVTDITQSEVSEAAKPVTATDAPAAAPIRVAQNTPAPAPAPAAAAAAPAPAQSAPICDTPDRT